MLRSRSSSRPGSVRGLTWLAVFGATLFVLLVGAELVLRTWLWGPAHFVRHDRLGSVGAPHARIVRSKEGWIRDRLDARGLPDVPPRGPVEHRVMVIGDSFTEALQLPFAQNYCSLVEREHPGVEVINAGGSGRSPAYTAAVLDAYAPDDLDLAVIQISEADAWQIFERHRVHLEPDGEGGYREVVPAGFTHYSGAGGLRMRLMRSSAVAFAALVRMEKLRVREERRLAARFAGDPALAAAPADPESPDGDPAAAMDSIVAGARARGVEVVLLFIAELEYDEPGLPMRRPGHREYWRRYAQERGIGFADPIDEFREEFRRTRTPSHGFHNSRRGTGHLNATGHRLTAGALGRVLDRVLGQALDERRR